MADLSSPSFIPKQNPVKNTRRAASRQVYILTLVSYLMIITSLIAVAALFAYDRYTQNALAQQIESLNKEIEDFKANDMETVIDLNERLSTTKNLLDRNVSLRSVLAIVEDSTIDTVQFESVTFTREGGGNIQLDATIKTDSFDSVLFQRQMYEAAKKLQAVELKEVAISLAATSPNANELKNTVSFSALFTVNPDEALYTPDRVAARATSTASTSVSALPVPTSTLPVPTSTLTP